LAKGIGFKRFTRPSVWKGNSDPKLDVMIRRTGSSSRVVFRGTDLGLTSLFEFYSGIKILEGKKLYRHVKRLLLVLRIIKHYIADSK